MKKINLQCNDCHEIYRLEYENELVVITQCPKCKGIALVNVKTK